MPGYGQGGYGRQNQAARDAMLGMFDEYEMGEDYEGIATPGGYDPMQEESASGMNLGQEGQDTPPDGAGMAPQYDGSQERRRRF